MPAPKLTPMQRFRLEENGADPAEAKPTKDGRVYVKRDGGEDHETTLVIVDDSPYANVTIVNERANLKGVL